MKFTIDRSKWRAGKHADNAVGLGWETLLLNNDGFLCCLGQCALQLGANSDELIGKGTPAEVLCQLGDSMDKVERFTTVAESMIPFSDSLHPNTILSEEAMSINDRHTLDRDEREHDLAALFVRHGHEIEFVGDYVDFQVADTDWQDGIEIDE